MKSIIVICLLMFFMAGVAGAEELSIMGNMASPAQVVKEKQEAPVKVLPADKSEVVEEGTTDSLDSMKNYIDMERKKQDEINGLTREIQKYGLELQKKELLQKINEVSAKTGTSSTNAVIQSPAGHNDGQAAPAAAISVSYISIAKVKEALLTIEGLKVLAEEGQVLATGHTVKKINSDKVVLEDKSGNVITVMFNSMGL